MNHIEIKPESFLNKTAKFVKVTAKEFVTNADCVNFDVTFYEDITFSPMPIEGKVLFKTTLSMDGQDLDGWGSNDTYAEDWCLSELGLERKAT